MIDLNELVLSQQSEPATVAEPRTSSVAGAENISAIPDQQPASDQENRLLQEVEIWKSKCASLAAERELAVALTGQPLLPGVAGQLIELLKTKIVANANANQGFEIKSNDGRSLNDAVRDWLSKPEFQHFRQALTKGGTATRTETAATERMVSTTSQSAKSLNEVVIHQWRQRMNRPSPTGGWPQ